MIHDMIHARNVAEKRGIWVVIVVPDSIFPQALKTFGAVVPAGHFSGRTAVLGEGRLSLVGGNSEVFLHEPFCVMFLGWSEGKTSPNLSNWRQQAMEEIRRAP